VIPITRPHFPPKPKGMWLRTYERLWYQFCEAEERAEAAFDMQAAAIRRWASRHFGEPHPSVLGARLGFR